MFIQPKLSQKDRKALAAKQKEEAEAAKKAAADAQSFKLNANAGVFVPGQSFGAAAGAPKAPGFPQKAGAAAAAPAQPASPHPDTATEDMLAKLVTPHTSTSPVVTLGDRLTLLAQLRTMALETKDTRDPSARESALLAYKQLCNSWVSGVLPLTEAHLISQTGGLLGVLLERLADKKPSVRTAAEQLVKALPVAINPHSVKEVVLPALFEAMGVSKNWQTKTGALAVLSALAKRPQTARHVAEMLPSIVPRLTELMHDAKEAVKKTAVDCMVDVCSTVGNRDLEPCIPAIISCIQHNEEIAQCITKIAETTFVQTVGSGELAITVPLLLRGLRERITLVKRKAALICGNMAKLVEEARDAEPFLPELLPELAKQAEEVADPEIRAVLAASADILKRLKERAEALRAEEGDVHDITQSGRSLREKISFADRKQVALGCLLPALRAALPADMPPAVADQLCSEQNPICDHIAALCACLMAEHCFVLAEWSSKAFAPYIAPLVIADKNAANAACQSFLNACIEQANERFYKSSGAEKQEETDPTDTGEVLCNCKFSMGYGAKMLLQQTELMLRRGNRYGLVGANGVGKSTLLRSISNGQLDGFPSADELRTVYVAHDLDGSVNQTEVTDFLLQDARVKAAGHATLAEVKAKLTEFGFSEALQHMAVANLSGGWRMKLALARAVLMGADILLLDEPTNHLDVTNVAWLENYLKSLTSVTSIIVSHDSGFLDNVCTDIIYYFGRKLKNYRGNLSKFVEKKPEARSYYELDAAAFAFTFPAPGFLDGIKDKQKPVMRMTHVSFGYPGIEEKIGRKTLVDITCKVSMGSRIAVLGPNGAGKSTLIKLMTQELAPDEGTVWKHPNLRVAYVAQHAFHHVEQHLEMTANDYIQWRYLGNEDKENQNKVDRKGLEEERARQAEEAKKREEMDALEMLNSMGQEKKESEPPSPQPGGAADGGFSDERVGEGKGVLALLSRRKKYRDFEYQVEWEGYKQRGWPVPSWHLRSQLVKWGCGKLVAEMDAKEASAAGLAFRKLERADIQKHFEDFGLEAELTFYTKLKSLSGGQKVKVVLAAAMWNNPHVLVMDEPTNYLDRDSLGALAGAVKKFQGGVVVISHNSEFALSVSNEGWYIRDGRLVVEAISQTAADAATKAAPIEH